METKYLSLDGLSKYDALIKAEMLECDAELQSKVDELSANVAFISDSNEDIVIDDSGVSGSALAGTIHRFSVEVNCAPM